MLFYKKANGKWIIDDTAIPAGTCVEQTDENGLITISDPDNGTVYAGSVHPSQFQYINNGVVTNYASLEAYEEATKDFFFKALGDGGVVTPYRFVKGDNGELVLKKQNDFVAQFSPSGSVFSKSVTTGVGSFHLGSVHAIGSAGNRITFINKITGNSVVIPLQTCKPDGTVDQSAKNIKFGALTTNEPAGALAAGSTAYGGTVTPLVDTVFFSVDIVPFESYSGVLSFSGVSGGIEVSSMDVNVSLTAGTLYKLILDYPFFIKSGQSGVTTIKKADGTALSVRIGANGQAYRKLYYRTYTEADIIDRDTLNSVGDVKYSIRASDFDGWMMCDGRTLTDAQWQKVIDTGLSTQWTNLFGLKKLPDARGHVLGASGQGASLTNRAQGSKVGAETHTLGQNEMPNHFHLVDPPASNTSSGGAYNTTLTSTATFAVSFSGISGRGTFEEGQGGTDLNVNYVGVQTPFNMPNHTHPIDMPAFNSNTAGGGQSHNNMQPTFFAGNYFIFVG